TTHRMVLVDLRPVMNRHVPAAEVDHPRAGSTVKGIERRRLEHGGSGAKKWATRPSASPRLSLVPERLRRKRRTSSFPPACPFGGPHDCRRRPLSRSIAFCRSPFCLSGFGITPSAAPHWPSSAFGARSPATNGRRLSAAPPPVKMRTSTRRYFFNVRIQATSALTSASGAVGLGGMGTWPHAPEPPRSEERRVGKEWRSRWPAYHYKER